MFVPTGRTVSVVVIIPIRAVAMNNAVAVITADVILIEAMLAERMRVILDDILLIKSLGNFVSVNTYK